MPALPRTVPLPGGVRQADVPSLDLQGSEPETDEFGLATAIYGEYPREQRRLVAVMLREVGGNKRARPPFGATIPEAVFFGLLIDNGFEWTTDPTVRVNQFRFQSYELGGRQPGGSVTDFYVNVNGTRVAVRVNGAFHSLNNPFGGGGQVLVREARLRTELLASRFIDRVVDVNDAPGRILETSETPHMVQRELWRVIGWSA